MRASPEKLLLEVMRADEDISIPRKVMNALRDAGLVTICGCSDGDYIEPTEAGRAVLRKYAD